MAKFWKNLRKPKKKKERESQMESRMSYIAKEEFQKEKKLRGNTKHQVNIQENFPELKSMGFHIERLC